MKRQSDLLACGTRNDGPLAVANATIGIPLEAPAILNRTWALDFMSDRLYDGRYYRLLNMLGGNRESLAIEVYRTLRY